MVIMNTLPSYIHLQNVQCLYCRRENYIQTILYRSSSTGVAQNKNIVKSVYSAITTSDHPFVQLHVTQACTQALKIDYPFLARMLRIEFRFD